MPPFVKWLGGKGSMVQELAKSVPADFTHYVEPMAGGAALFWHLADAGRLKNKQVMLADANEHLMHAYRAVRDDVDNLIYELSRMQADYEGRPELLFHLVRREWNQGTRSPARFIFLKQTSFNGLWRVNKAGDINMPWGRYATPRICHARGLRACHEHLQGVELRTGDYAESLAKRGKGHVVYCDPPYLGTFDAYTSSRFWPTSHRHLLERCAALVSAGATVIYTHNDSPEMLALLKEIWPSGGIRRVRNRRSISCRGDGRSPVHDLLVSEPACSPDRSVIATAGG